MDQVVFDKVSDLVRDGHQVMVFVHARKETVKTAQRLREMAIEEGLAPDFDTSDHPRFSQNRRDIGTSRNREMKELFDAGFGIHHAGMLRSDRNMMERMFEDNCIKVRLQAKRMHGRISRQVLCCTSTLAWGVNLPAHAVVIKGTQVYDSNRGSFVDLSVLDVLQIFGRAGRPGYETSGVGYICTTQDKLDHYLYSIITQRPIESKFQVGLTDALNAEIALGTIATVQDAVSWIGYTYLFVRMRKEPMVYGMSHDEPRDDPQLGRKRSELVTQAARHLAAAKMIQFDEHTSTFAITDLGRIAAKYYIKYNTVEVFAPLFKSNMGNADIFAMLSQATEFAQIQVRDNEIDELTAIMTSRDQCPMEVKGGANTAPGKVNILLQAHISQVYIEDFALVSDAAYVAQNAGRIIRALLEIALYRNWAQCSWYLIDLSKSIERRIWPFEHPLAQFSTLQRETKYNLRRYAEDTEVADLVAMDAGELGKLLHMNEQHGAALKSLAATFPHLSIEHKLQPLSHDLLQIVVRATPQFTWSTKLSGSAEPFYIWVQSEDGMTTLQWRSVLLRPTTKAVEVEFAIPWKSADSGREPPASIGIVSVSDRWLGAQSQDAVPLMNLVMPARFEEATPLLDLPFLNIAALQDRELEDGYRKGVRVLNGIQTQAFWSVYHTQNNVLVSAPVASGKSLLGEMAIWHMFRHNPEAVALVVVPQRQASGETAARIRSVVPKSKRIAISTAFKPADLDAALSTMRQVIVATPAAFTEIIDDKLVSLGQRVSLFLLEDLHLLDPVYELAIAKLLLVGQPARTRVVGLTCSLNNPSDLAAWLGVDHAYRFAFFPQHSGTPIVTTTRRFTIPHSATLLKSMIKPVYDDLKATTSAGGNTVVFVPSRTFVRAVAADLVTQSGTEFDLAGFLAAPRADVEPVVQHLRDPALLEPLLHGVGYVLPTMAPGDLALVLELFAAGIVRALVAPREACWTLPVRASNVVLMGAQYTETAGGPGADRQTRAYSHQEVVRMQAFAAGRVGSQGRMTILCQAEQEAGLRRMLADGLPLESDLPAVLRRDPAVAPAAIDMLARALKARDPPRRAHRHGPPVPDLRKRDVVDLVGWTLFARRIRSNPSYYGMIESMENDVLSRLVDAWVDGARTETPAAANLKHKVEAQPQTNGEDKGAVKRKDKGKGKNRHANTEPDGCSSSSEGEEVEFDARAVPLVTDAQGAAVKQANERIKHEEVNVFEVGEEVGVEDDGEAWSD
ncbi:putative steryl acetyl hydrolase mug81 [Cryptotrichosporon argae]